MALNARFAEALSIRRIGQGDLELFSTGPARGRQPQSIQRADNSDSRCRLLLGLLDFLVLSLLAFCHDYSPREVEFA